MLTNSTLILLLFILPEAKHPSNQKVVISTGPGRTISVVILIPTANDLKHGMIFWKPQRNQPTKTLRYALHICK